MPLIDLTGRAVLITGGSRGLGAVTAQRFAAAGAHVAVNYVSAQAAAEELCARLAKDYGVKAVPLKADVGIKEECHKLVEQSIAQLGGLDVIVSNAGWTKIGAHSDLNALSEADWDKCWATNVKANLHLLQAAEATFNANATGGSLLITSSIAGQNPVGSSMAYSVSKAAGLHMMRCMANALGPKIRVNAVLPGLLLTEWGSAFGEERIEQVRQKAALKDVVSIEECADAFVLMARSGAMTGSALKIDAGLHP